MKEFLHKMLTGIGDTISSKRVVMMLFVLAFLAELVANGAFKVLLDHNLQDQLDNAMWYSMALVFGERAIPAIKGTFDKKEKDQNEDSPNN